MPIGNGKFALVDDEDYALLNEFRWKPDEFSGHVVQTGGSHSANKRLYMHHLIMEPYLPFWVVHRDRNLLNLQKSNLVLCLPKEAMTFRRPPTPRPLNDPPKRRSKSGYYGVYQIVGGRWRAIINKNRIQYRFGTHTTPEGAAIAYNKAVLRMWPKGAHYLNDIPFTDGEYVYKGTDIYYAYRARNNA